MLPEEIHPDLQWDRLEEVAQALVDTRNELLELHEPDDGDGAWSLGCRVYERSCNVLRSFEEDVPWLKVCTQPNTLAFFFTIGSVPCRFYRGAAELPSARTTRRRGDEIRQLQLAFGSATDEVNYVWRFVVETAPDASPLRVALTRLDEMSQPAGDWTIWTRDSGAGAAPVHDAPPPAFDLPPPDVGVIGSASDEERDDVGSDGE